MASIQESLRAVLGENLDLKAIVEDRIYPGDVPDDEDPTPWLYYSVLEDAPYADLDGDGDTIGDVEFHSLADTYAEAKQILDLVDAILDGHVGGQVSRAFRISRSEEFTDEGYHHVSRYQVIGVTATITESAGSNARIRTGLDSITLFAGGHTLTLNSDGLNLDAPNNSPYARKDQANTFTAGQTITTASASDVGLVVKASASQTASLAEWRDSTGAVLSRVTPGGASFWGGNHPTISTSINGVACGRFPDGRSVFILHIASGTNEGQLLFINNSGSFVLTTNFDHHLLQVGNGANSVATWGGDLATTSYTQRHQLQSSSNTRTVAECVHSWVTSTDATRKARFVWNVFDTAAREVMRGEASGSAPMVGFLGAAAVARPNVTGSRGGNAALASLLTAIASLGLITDSTTA